MVAARIVAWVGSTIYLGERSTIFLGFEAKGYIIAAIVVVGEERYETERGGSGVLYEQA